MINFNISARFYRLPQMLIYLCCWLAFTTLGACVATEKEAQVARTKLIAEHNRLDALAAQFSDTLTQIAVIPPLQLLIEESPGLPLRQHTFDELSPLYGIYQETANGDYNFTRSFGHITVEKLNGIRIQAHYFNYTTDLKLISFRLNVNPDNGVTTPVTERVYIDFIQQRFSQAKAPLLPIFANGAVKLTGRATIPNNGTSPSHIVIQREYGELAQLDVQFAWNVRELSSLLRITDLSEAAIEIPTWTATKKSWHVPSSLPGIWVRELAEESFTSASINYDYRITLESKLLDLTGQAIYNATGNVYWQYKRAAKLSGGPYHCDAAQLQSPGSGTPIQIEWADQVTQAFFPSVDYTCPQAFIITLP